MTHVGMLRLKSDMESETTLVTINIRQEFSHTFAASQRCVIAEVFQVRVVMVASYSVNVAVWVRLPST